MMTKTNEPLDPFNETSGQSEGDSARKFDDEWREPASDAAKTNHLWSGSPDSESVEEAFLALIQSNKPQEAAPLERPRKRLPENLSLDDQFGAEFSAPDFSEPARKPRVQDDETHAFFSINQDSFDSAIREELDNLAPAKDTDLQPFRPSMEETSLHERLAEEIFSDLSSDDLHDVTVSDGRSITDALSDTIAESLAELQYNQQAEEVFAAAKRDLPPMTQNQAMNSAPVLKPGKSQKPQMPPQQQPPVLPHSQFSRANPLDGFPAPNAEGNFPAQEFIPRVMPHASHGDDFDGHNNNDVMEQLHTNPISYAHQKSVRPGDLNQIPDDHFVSDFRNVSVPSRSDIPPSISLASQSGAKRTKVDPEFQALVQWSNSDVEPSHHGPHDIPNFLSQKREEESRFSFKTVFISVGISAVVIGMFYMGYQAGRVKETANSSGVYDATASAGKQDNGIIVEQSNQNVAENMFNGDGQSNRAAVKPKASILEFSVADLSGTSGKSIPMNIRLEGNNLGLETMLLFRGIPEKIALSRGLKREGVWSVPISDLDKLALVVPDDYKGRFDFEVFAFKDKESGPERRLASVRIEGIQQISQPVQSQISGIERQEIRENVQVQPKQQQKLASINTDNQDNLVTEQRIEVKPQEAPVEKQNKVSESVEAAMLQRGNELLKNGDISGARLVFEHVAIQGSKHAAFALARTYDEEFLEQLYIKGIVPEMELAIKWYKKAASLGHQEAMRRLSKLGLQ